jgi:serine protease Do
MTRNVKIMAFGFIICLAGIGKVVHILYERQQELEHRLLSMQTSNALDAHIDVGMQASQAISEKLVSSSQLWRSVQEQVKDTVVQVFAQIAAVDLLQPYKSPAQYSASGSGFFINENGELLTNAHVVDQAKLWIQIPSLGKRIIDVDVVSVSPERDLALLRVRPEGLKVIKDTLGSVPFLSLGDSDSIRRSDEVMALGYPLGQQSLKSTTGVVSGHEQHLIQMSAAINPGSSGGPLLNARGQVVGINCSGITEAQNTGYAIPSNDFKIVENDMHKVKLLRKPFLGVLFNNATDSLTEYLGNPAPGGCYVVEVVGGSTLDKAGIKKGDMIYEINGHKMDIFGEMSVPWSEDKVSIIDYVCRLSIGEDLKLVAYRKGERKEVAVKFSQAELPAIRRLHPGYEHIDYEVFGGMVVMQLSLNHIQLLMGQAPGLTKFAELKNQGKKKLVITHIFPNSQLHRSRALAIGATLNEVNGMQVSTLDDLRKAIKEHASDKFFTIAAADNVARASDNILITLPFDKVLEEEPKLAFDFKYPLSQVSRELIRARDANSALVLAQQPAVAQSVTQQS